MSRIILLARLYLLCAHLEKMNTTSRYCTESADDILHLSDRTVAITPSRSDAYEWDEVQRVCLRSPLVALKTMIDARSEAAFGPNLKPIRFVYMSGIASERDQTKTPSFKPKYSLLRVSLIRFCPPLLSRFSVEARKVINQVRIDRVKLKVLFSHSRKNTDQKSRCALQNLVGLLHRMII